MKLTKIFKTTALTAFFAATSISAIAAVVTEPFEVSIKLIEPLTITEVASLRFPEQEAGTAQQLPVQTFDSGAAQFNITGEPLRFVAVSIVEQSITMKIGLGGSPATEIVVNDFKIEGLHPTDKNVQLTGTGTANNIRVGASANIEADDQSGDYKGVATFRVIYS